MCLTRKKCFSRKIILPWKKCHPSKKNLPQKNYFTISVFFKKSLPRKLSFHHPKLFFIKKSVSLEKRVSPEKMFHLKNLTEPKKVFKGMQHLCKDSEFSTSENFGKFNTLGPSTPLEEYVYKFSARLLKNSSRNMVWELKFS